MQTLSFEEVRGLSLYADILIHYVGAS